MVTPLVSSLPSNPTPFKDHKVVFSKYLARNRQVFFGDHGSVYVLGRRFELTSFLKRDVIDKDDYLFVYTFFYLDFDISELDDYSWSCITESHISKEPFVLSQQIYNLISDYDSIAQLVPYDYLLEQYKCLCQCIEYHVDGNHVIENLMSICLFEIYFLDNGVSVKLLVRELSRQTDGDGHLERNAKYTFDILIKLLAIVDLLDKKSIKHDLNIYTDRLKQTLTEFYHASFFSHDNIVGDGLAEDIATLLKISPQWFPSKMLRVRSAKGMSGHSFDSSNFAPLPANLRCFGTYHYANTLKRMFQRKRINNAQLCFDKTDRSIWFWKSFRILFKLPSLLLKTSEGNFVMEFVVSGSKLRLLSYKWQPLKNGWSYESSRELLYKVYVDDLPQISQSEIICDDFKFLLSPGDEVFLKPTVRASALGFLVKTHSLIIRSKSFALVKSR